MPMRRNWPDDAALLDVALSGIDELEPALQQGATSPVSSVSPAPPMESGEGKWMGWERKRGKLDEFNRILRGARDTSFMVQTADQALLSQVRFVITLDSDTQLPRDVARKLVGTAIHPLNRPRIDPATNRVTSGYGILQPRVSISLESASRSRFARIFSGNTGIDPYTTAVSDVYQDLFGEGNYTGKGLYDVDALKPPWTDACRRIRCSVTISLSRSSRARLWLPTSSFSTTIRRTTTLMLTVNIAGLAAIGRLFSWLFPTVPDAHGRKVRNVLPLISRWKILDNLRRSLVAPSLFLWLLAAWTFFPGSTLLWTLFVVLAIAFPVYLHVTTSLLIHPRGIPWTSHFWSVWGDIRTNTAQVALSFILLPHQAYLMLDAIVRTLYRKLISRRKLLEWVTAAQAESSARHDLPSFLWFMLPAELLTLAAAGAQLVTAAFVAEGGSSLPGRLGAVTLCRLLG